VVYTPSRAVGIRDVKLQDQDINLKFAETIDAIGTVAFMASMAHLVKACVDFDTCSFFGYKDGWRPWSPYQDSCDPELHQWAIREYLNTAYLLDPAYQLHTTQAPEGLYRIFDIAPNQFRSTEFFRQFYVKTGVVDELVFLAYLPFNATMTFCVCRDHTSKKFLSVERKFLNRIAPTICALIRKSWKCFEETLDVEPQEGLDIDKRLQSFVLNSRKVNLTKRQTEVAFLILKGYSSYAIGEKLRISEQTVKVFRRQLYARCNISSQIELYNFFMPAFLRSSEWTMFPISTREITPSRISSSSQPPRIEDKA
jgi:DNA-binding CsgD family transcriptional regulator